MTGVKSENIETSHCTGNTINLYDLIRTGALIQSRRKQNITFVQYCKTPK